MEIKRALGSLAFIAGSLLLGCSSAGVPAESTETAAGHAIIRCAEYECCPVSACADSDLVCDYKVGKCVVPKYAGDCGKLNEGCCSGDCNQGLACSARGRCELFRPMTCDIDAQTCEL